jgi:hypothetical protein
MSTERGQPPTDSSPAAALILDLSSETAELPAFTETGNQTTVLDNLSDEASNRCFNELLYADPTYGAELYSPFHNEPDQMLVHSSQKTVRDVGESVLALIASRLQYSIDRLHEAPSTMVSELQTPWCHPTLYRDSMPKSIQGTTTKYN